MPTKPSSQQEKKDKGKGASGLSAARDGVKEACQRFFSLFRDEKVEEATIFPEPAAVIAEYQVLTKKIKRQNFIILGLLASIIFLFPVLRPIYKYQALGDDGKSSQRLVSLSMPNMTDQAVLSWAATSITEILTIGFGDFDRRILSQRPLFTPDGWEGFLKGIRQQNMVENFKLRQLVLTTAPANMPVIVGRGEDVDGLYKWLVEMPVIMTYTTNNNVTDRKRGIVRLTIVRVSPKQNPQGVGIKGWQLL